MSFHQIKDDDFLSVRFIFFIVLSLFQKFFSTLKPGGILLISDYCKGDQNNSQTFKDYVKQRGYHLLTVKDYGKAIEKAGFKVIFYAIYIHSYNKLENHSQDSEPAFLNTYQADITPSYVVIF